MKNMDMLSSSNIALAAMSAHVYGPNFMTARQRVVSLKPLPAASPAGYVWRRIFLGRRPGGEDARKAR